MTELFLGADVGGSSTRVAVASLADGIVQVAFGGPGNPNVVGPDGSTQVIRATAERALAGVPGTVVAAVLGLAGGSRVANDPAFLAAALPERASGPRMAVSDLAVAFSSATPAWTGCTLIAGTGAVAARLVGLELQDRRDGWGWLLGDGGSGYWLGRAAVRSTLQALDEDGPLDGLHREVLSEAESTDYLSLLQACYAHPPTWLARLAPLVSRWADQEPRAGALADEAARLLAVTLSGLVPRVREPVVLAGSVLDGAAGADPGPVGRRLVARLPEDLTLLQGGSGLVGATWIAARRHGPTGDDLHGRLSSTVASARRG
ncbi:N-acetylglucosamine kinase [uncultured Friedmanniella sp.]|uniref:N-acetylglucosamine kinase n=1 Tax=uncultured Friedmanniella sp. TaxID=335381 RepID=UPI0035CA8E1D